jgi:hypothetical protein
METQLNTKDMLLTLLRKELITLNILYLNMKSEGLFSTRLTVGYLIQKSQGVWEFKTEAEVSSISEKPISFHHIYPYIYRVEANNNIPQKEKYTVKDVTIDYADQLIPFASNHSLLTHHNKHPSDAQDAQSII